MNCELCSKNDASVHLKQVCNGKVNELYVCGECAAKHGFDLQAPLPITELLLGVGAPQNRQDKADDRRCAACNITESEFRERTRLGCAQCYESFAEELRPLLKGMHRGERHVGKAPAGKQASIEVQGLRQSLDKAVAEQRFEDAAVLRDRISALRTPPPGQAGEGG